MSEDGYKSGGTVGGKWGCAIAALVTVPVFGFLLIADALGDCVPDIECHKGFWTFVFTPSAILAIVVGVTIRAIVDKMIARR